MGGEVTALIAVAQKIYGLIRELRVVSVDSGH